MFEKRAKHTIPATDMQFLNKPDFSHGFIKDQKLVVDNEIVNNVIKMGQSIQIDKNSDGAESPVFDLESEIEQHPDSLFIKCLAIVADETNDNGDYFSQDELRKAASTFIGVPLFTNHSNSDINEARGKVVHSWWDEDKNGIMIVGRVDAAAYPQLARGIKEEYIINTSMGASRGHDLVTMADGSKKRVDLIQIGDSIITHSGKNENIEAVCQTQENSKLYHIKWSGNLSGLALSYEHPVLVLRRENLYRFSSSNKKYRREVNYICENVNPEFIPASELKHEDYVLEWIDKTITEGKEINEEYESFFYKDFIAHKIKKVIVIDNAEPTYYIQVGKFGDEDSDKSYILNDIATHNCQVQHSLCSVCHNYSETPDDYCGCIRERKTRVVAAKKQKCQYFEHGIEDKCPMCQSSKNQIKTFDYNGKVFEYNYGIKFIENSFVTHPACSDCGVTEVIDPQKFIAKVAECSAQVAKMQSKLSQLIKSEELPLTCTDQQCIKIAGQSELDQLNQALDLCSSVSKTMLDQKEQIDLEFLSDLVKVVADLQETIDELTEQGYGRLQSPGQPPPETPGTPEVTTEGPPGEVTRAVPPPPTGGNIQTGPAGAAGTVTGPLAKQKVLSLEKMSSNLLNREKTLNILFRLENKLKHVIKFASRKHVNKLKLSFSLLEHNNNLLLLKKIEEKSE